MPIVDDGQSAGASRETFPGLSTIITLLGVRHPAHGGLAETRPGSGHEDTRKIDDFRLFSVLRLKSEPERNTCQVWVLCWCGAGEFKLLSGERSAVGHWVMLTESF